jgi:hypothetical protein
VNPAEDLDELQRRGEAGRARVHESWRRTEEETRRLFAEGGRSARRAGATLQWGGSLFLASALLYRLLRLRRGWRMMRWIWAFTPAMTRFAMRRLRKEPD